MYAIRNMNKSLIAVFFLICFLQLLLLFPTLQFWSPPSTANSLKGYGKERIAIVMPTITAQIQKMGTQFALSNEPEFAACESQVPVDLVLFISTDWDVVVDGRTSRTRMERILTSFPKILSCVDNVRYINGHIRKEDDIHTATDFTGPNKQFRMMFNMPELTNNYDYFFILEPDTTPIRPNWLEGLVREVELKVEPFWLKGG